MIKKISILIFCLLPGISLFSQESTKKISWGPNPEYSVINEGNEKENIVGIFHNEKYEMYISEKGDFESIHIQHRRLRLNNDEAIDRFNKLSVPLKNAIEVIEIAARVIKPDARVVTFDKNNIKEVVDDDNGDSYKIFAIDGIEKGDDIEYMITRKIAGRTMGQTVLQFDYPMQESSFEIISPSNLIYVAKGYNGCPNPTPEKLQDGRNILKCSFSDMPALKKMEYFYYNSNRARIEFKLDQNTRRGNAKIFTWNDASQRVHEMMYEDVKKKTIDTWLKAIKVKGGSPLEKAFQVEEYIKNNIYLFDFSISDFSDLDFIFNKKVSNETGVTRLYATLFKALGINHQLVLTTKRSAVKFDPDFQTYNYLDEYLIYLPDYEVFIEPGSSYLRKGVIDGELTATYGLFIELVKISGFESAIGKTKFIQAAPYSSNYDKMNIHISVDLENKETRIVHTRGFKGLSGGFYSQLYKSMDAERKQFFLEDIMKTKAPDPTFKSLKVLDKTEVDFMKNADFYIFCDFITPSFLEMAGDKVLLNIGQSIGPQVELYHDDERTIGGESSFNRLYFRKIIVDIPQGYRIVNPEDADMSIIEKSDNEEVFGFVSKHLIKGNQYIVEVEEYYKQIEILLSQFEGFRSVINAAADFNKITLILEKIAE